MRRHRKERKRQKKIIIFSLMGIICMLGVGYAAFSSNFIVSGKGTIVSGPITINQLKEQTVDSGDGLYKDLYEDSRYFYRGTNPNNYIKLNGELWRIVALESDGTVKIVKDEKLADNLVFDPGYFSSFTNGDLVVSANSVSQTRYSSNTTHYCNKADETAYKGCNVWGSKTTTYNSSMNNITSIPLNAGSDTTYELPESESYLNSYLNGTQYLNKTLAHTFNLNNSNIVDHIFNVGKVAYTSTDLSATINQEKTYKWYGKVGLLGPSDYIRSSTYGECNSMSTSWDSGVCKNENYLYKNSYGWWLITMSDGRNGETTFVYSNGELGSANGNTGTSGRYGVRPCVYLKKDIILTGNGTREIPYQIK